MSYVKTDRVAHNVLQSTMVVQSSDIPVNRVFLGASEQDTQLLSGYARLCPFFYVYMYIDISSTLSTLPNFAKT